jgi:hypothetical protein
VSTCCFERRIDVNSHFVGLLLTPSLVESSCMAYAAEKLSEPKENCSKRGAKAVAQHSVRCCNASCLRQQISGRTSLRLCPHSFQDGMLKRQSVATALRCASVRMVGRFERNAARLRKPIAPARFWVGCSAAGGPLHAFNFSVAIICKRDILRSPLYYGRSDCVSN